MSNNSSINISPKNISGKCDLKCSYQFKYPITNLTAKNNEVMITLTYENNSNPAVVFNENKYNVSNIYIYSPSLHYFNDNKTIGEIMIEHYPISGGENLYVSIPLIQSSDVNSASSLISNIIVSIARSAPAKNDTVNLNIQDFTLQNIVPKSPFYNYTGTGNMPGQFVVFGLNNAIPISKSTSQILQKIIKPYDLILSGGNLFLNSKGPNSSLKDQGIYISCKPTGSSSETTDVEVQKSSSSGIEFGSLFQENRETVELIFKIFIVTAICIAFIYALNAGYKYITEGNMEMPTIASVPKINFKLPSFKKG